VAAGADHEQIRILGGFEQCLGRWSFHPDGAHVNPARSSLISASIESTSSFASLIITLIDSTLGAGAKPAAGSCGIRQACNTTSTECRNRASSSAQRRARFEASEPSTPTTIPPMAASPSSR
jgi:hypothetical protein